MEIPLQEILPHLSERGRVEFDLAVEKAKNRRLMESIRELKAQLDAET